VDHWVKKSLRVGGVTLAWLILSAISVWASAAWYFDFPKAGLRLPLALMYALCVLVAVCLLKRIWAKVLAVAASFLIVLLWWLSLKPSNDRPWQADVSRTAFAVADAPMTCRRCATSSSPTGDHPGLLIRL
jgi:hypothetical protein